MAFNSAFFQNGGYRKRLYSALMLADYMGTNVVPQITNHDYEGDIQGKGSIVTIRKPFDIEVFDYENTSGMGHLKTQQSAADTEIDLEVKYAHYFNVPVGDLDRVFTDVEFTEQILTRGSKALAKKVERQILQSVYLDAATTIAITSLDDVKAWKSLMLAMTRMGELDVPVDDPSKMWAVVDPMFAYFLGISDLRDAAKTGEGDTSMRTGTAIKGKRVGGFTVYVSNNLYHPSAGATKCICGHMDALTFAGKITKTEEVRNTADFGDLIRSLICYGYKTLQSKGLVCLDVQSLAATGVS